ncbi:MAG: methyltransferase domain-containing protein [bacterium]|nr:methyltransferase domain-containing protein [bacterium]
MFVVPEETVRRLPIREGQVIADFGCGTGIWSLAMARLVGDHGRIIALEVQKNLLEALERTAQESGITHIETVWADLDEPEGSRLAHESVDGVLVANSLFQFENKAEMVREAYRVLKHGGWCAVVDWTESFGGLGPAPDHVVTADEARVLFASQSFVFNSMFTTGAHHYGVLFKK